MQLSESAAKSLRSRWAYLNMNRSGLVVDGDVHPTFRQDIPPAIARRMLESDLYFHGRPLIAEELTEKLDEAGIDMAVCWQNPAATEYTDDIRLNADRLRQANVAIARLGGLHPQRVIPAGWTDPKALGLSGAIDLARACVQEFGMPIVKMNPAQNAFPIDADEVMEVVDAIVELGAIPAFHFGSDTPFTPPEGLRKVALRHPAHPVIAVHMGGGGGGFVEADPIYRGAHALGLELPNIFYVLSAMRDVYAEDAMVLYNKHGEPQSDNIGLGSDAPYCSMVWTFGAARAFIKANPASTASDKILGCNLVRLVADADARILERAGLSLPDS